MRCRNAWRHDQQAQLDWFHASSTSVQEFSQDSNDLVRVTREGKGVPVVKVHYRMCACSCRPLRIMKVWLLNLPRHPGAPAGQLRIRTVTDFPFEVITGRPSAASWQCMLYWEAHQLINMVHSLARNASTASASCQQPRTCSAPWTPSVNSIYTQPSRVPCMRTSRNNTSAGGHSGAAHERERNVRMHDYTATSIHRSGVQNPQEAHGVLPVHRGRALLWRLWHATHI